eukprot:13020158-Alexandrium_andersonii.AAC.1
MDADAQDWSDAAPATPRAVDGLPRFPGVQVGGSSGSADVPPARPPSPPHGGPPEPPPVPAPVVDPADFLQIARWGFFGITPRQADKHPPFGRFEARCPYHRRNLLTGCKKEVRVEGPE